MAGLVPSIRVFFGERRVRVVGRDKPGHRDESMLAASAMRDASALQGKPALADHPV
jgi:hypothetical protein